jgi:hypothetical protein
MNDPATLRDRVFATYGGDAWKRARAVEAVVTAGGLGFFLKARRPLDRVTIRAEIGRPHSRITPFNREGHSAVLDGADVRIDRADGTVIQERKDARRFFPGGRRFFHWDDLDQAYFTGYAAWNYLVFPALLLRDDIRWGTSGPWTLTAEFPAHLPTHSPRQSFVIDPATHLVTRHDYTADVFGSWAKAGHVILKHESFDGIPVPVEREARPLLFGGITIPGLYFIRLRIHAWRLINL